MEKQKKLYFFPKTKIGKISFWLSLAGFIAIYIQYWIAMATSSSIPPLIGLLPLAILIIFGISSFRTIIKHNDKAILLFISSLLGLLGILLVIGEIGSLL